MTISREFVSPLSMPSLRQNHNQLDWPSGISEVRRKGNRPLKVKNRCYQPQGLPPQFIPSDSHTQSLPQYLILPCQFIKSPTPRRLDCWSKTHCIRKDKHEKWQPCTKKEQNLKRTRFRGDGISWFLVGLSTAIRTMCCRYHGLEMATTTDDQRGQRKVTGTHMTRIRDRKEEGVSWEDKSSFYATFQRIQANQWNINFKCLISVQFYKHYARRTK